MAGTTAFRWRHESLRAAKSKPQKLRGLVEADETDMLDSRKGKRISGLRGPWDHTTSV